MIESSTASVLHHRGFALFWCARVATAFGFQMQAVAVGWQMYALTNDPLDLGLIGLTQFLPALFLVLIAGQVADRADRRRIIGLCQVVQGVAAAILAMATALGLISPPLILAVVLIVGAARAFEAPTLQTIVPALVPSPLLPRAVAAMSSATQTAMIAGPALGGVLYLVGPTLVYAVCAALFAAGAVVLAMVEWQHHAVKREPLTLAMFFAGIAYIRRNPIILGAISLDLFAVLLGGALALLPVFARDVYDAGPWGLGLLRAAPAVGALMTSLVLSRWFLKRRVGPIMFAAVALFGLATVVFALTSSLVLALAALAVLGGADMISVVIRQTLVQIETPDEMRGRVSAINALFVVASNQLGDFRAGLIAAWFGAVPAVLNGGLGAVAVVFVWLRIFPQLARVDRFDDLGAGGRRSPIDAARSV
jgi:MFS family permease